MDLIDRDVPGPRRDYVGYGRNPPRVVWPDEARVAVNLIINYEEGSEIGMPADGKNEAALGEIPYAMPSTHRDLAMESVYEYGSRAGIWRLQRLFEEKQIKVTLFAAAIALERNPDVGKWIQDAGHEPCSHGWRWEEMWHLSRDEEKAHMAAAIKSFEQTCGSRPLGWYCRYGPSVHTRELIVEEGGFSYDSDAYNDDLPYYVEVSGTRHLVVPYTFTYNDARFVMAPGYGSPGDFFELLRRGFDYLWDEGATHPRMMSIGVHPRIIGQAARASGLKEFIEYAQKKGGVWFARRIDIANWWHEHHRDFETAIECPP
jgi:peptidoglycan/xylan/chitin deacetylase (PgdA/CDA1 family)